MAKRVLFLGLCLVAASCTTRPTADLKDEHWQLRVAAAESLGRVGGERAVSPLRAVLADDSGEVRAAALMALGRLGARAALDDVRDRMMNDKDPQVVVQAIFALSALTSGGDAERQRDVDRLVEKLSDDDRYVESAARRVLFRLESKDELVTMIRQDLRSRQPAIRTRASGLASALALPELAGWELNLVNDPEPEVRKYAYESVLQNLDTSHVVVLLKGLYDEDPNVRVAAAVGLEDLPDPAVISPLQTAAGGDEEPEVRLAAATALAAHLHIPGSALPGLWHFEKIADNLGLDSAGACTLTRTFTLLIDRSPEAIDNLKILLPSAFPEVDRVADAEGHPLPFTLEWKDGLRQVVFDVAPIETGVPATFTFDARSARPLSAGGAHELLVNFAPGPFQANVAALHVDLAGSKAFDRKDLSSHEAESLVVQFAIAAPDGKQPLVPSRSYSRAGDLTTAAFVVVAILLCLAAVVVRLRRMLGERADRAILVAVLTAGALVLLTPILVEDNLPYYALARSAVFDGDFDRVNEYTELNQNQAYAPRNRDPQDPVLASLVSTPFIAAAHGLTLGLNALAPEHAPNGVSFPYLFVTALGDFGFVLIGCLACFSLVERRVGGRYALFAVLSVVAGTNLVLFAYAWTGSSFQPSFMLLAVFLNYWDKTRDNRGPAGWLGAGVLLGLLGMTRTLNWGFAVLPFLDWCTTAVSKFEKKRDRGLDRHVGLGALLVGGMVLGFTPQLLVQRLVDNTWIVDAYGVGTGRFSGLREHLWGLFLNVPDGLLLAMPLFALALIGLWPLVRFDRRLGLLVAATLALQLLAIAAYEIYWGYFLYGTPYLVPCTPVFCLAMAALMRQVHTRWRRFGPMVLWGVVACCAARNGWCMVRQLADKMIGDWQQHLGIVDVAHTLLMLGRKFDVNMLHQSSEFCCLVRELTGAVRARDVGQLLTALFWASLVVVPVLLAVPIVARFRDFYARLSERQQLRIAGTAAALVWVATMGWIVSLGGHTDLEYGYRIRQRDVRKREPAIEHLLPGQSFTWEIESANPSDRFSVITFMDGAIDVATGEKVATVELAAGDARYPFDLRAGIDTADFAVDRPESKAVRAHTAPLDRAFFSWRVRDDSSRFYTARAYGRVMMAKVPARKTTLTVTSTLTHGAIDVVVATSREPKLPGNGNLRAWVADR